MDPKSFFERYRYDPETDNIGSGGYGTVYRAYDEVDARYRAVKISQVRDDKFSLRREVEMTQEIPEQQYVGRYIGCWRFNMAGAQLDYAVMPYFEHGSLESVLRISILTDADRRRILSGILSGLAHLHQHGVIHRDLKTHNILMDRRDGIWIPKIADFGMSRLAPGEDRSLVSNSAVGYTPSFAAPEQLLNRRIRKNVDLWAFGNIVFKVFTGSLPFDAPPETSPEDRISAITRSILGDSIPQQLLVKIPEPWRNIAALCLQKDPEARPQEAEELQHLLTSVEKTSGEHLPLLGKNAPSALSPPNETVRLDSKDETTVQKNTRPTETSLQAGPAPMVAPSVRQTKVPSASRWGWASWLAGGSLVAGIVLFALIRTKAIDMSTRPDAGYQMRTVIEEYHRLNALHDESFADLFSDRVSRFYLQKNIGKKDMVKSSKLWWAQYPYESHKVYWETYRWRRSSTGYFCSYDIWYCKRKTASGSDKCQSVTLTAEFDTDFHVTALY